MMWGDSPVLQYPPQKLFRLFTSILSQYFFHQVGPDTELSSSELLTLSCGVLFFFSFFVAMYVEVKAEFTIYQVCSNGIIKVFYIHLSRISPYPPSIYMTNCV